MDISKINHFSSAPFGGVSFLKGQFCMSEMLDAAKAAAQALTHNEWVEFMGWVVTDERKRRRTEIAADAARNEIAAEYLEANPPETTAGGVAVWHQPVGEFDAWPTGSVVTHNGAEWVNTLDRPNTHQPGDLNSGWVRRAEPGPDGAIEWAPGIAVKVGDRVRCDGKTWRAIVDHVTHDGWKPSLETFAVWALEPEPMLVNPAEQATTPEPAPEPEPEPDEEGDADTAAPDWKQPTGAHDAYKLGDRVTYNGAEYESLLPANVYSPDAYPAGWKKL